MKQLLTLSAFIFMLCANIQGAAALGEADDSLMFFNRLTSREAHASALSCIKRNYAPGAHILDSGSGIGFHTHALTKLAYTVTAADSCDVGARVLWRGLQRQQNY